MTKAYLPVTVPYFCKANPESAILEWHVDGKRMFIAGPLYH